MMLTSLNRIYYWWYFGCKYCIGWMHKCLSEWISSFKSVSEGLLNHLSWIKSGIKLLNLFYFARRCGWVRQWQSLARVHFNFALLGGIISLANLTSRGYRFSTPCKLGHDGKAREVLLRGKAQYSWPPCTNFFYNTIYLTKAVNCTVPSPPSYYSLPR